MGRKLDLSGLTDNEAEHVLQVVQRDMTLRKKEEKRLSELKQELDEEGSRCLLLSRQSCFNQRCCIRCCLPFTFLLNPKRQCHDCRYNICKACRVYMKQDKAWLCSACQKSRLLKTQSLEWFYTHVKRRFKRFGSAKVLKTLYRKHLAQHSVLSELTEGSAYEESLYNEGSVCGSDSTFYRQSEEHSMAETLTVALRVAEEAIDEAISEAEFDTASQEKQNEAHYLREHRGELIDELAKTIVQKIISRRKTLAEMRTEHEQDWPLGQNTDPHLHHHQSACDEASCSLKHRPGLWRSHSAFSLLSTYAPGLIQDSLQTLKKEGSGSTISAWKSVDRLDNPGVSSVLKSPDGNWIALQSAKLSRPTLLTQRKSLVYSALERESGVVSAYEGMDSDDETKPEPDGSWGSALQQIHRKMTDCNLNLQDTQDSAASPLTSRRGSRDALFSDSEGNWKPQKPLAALFKRKVPAEIRRASASQRTSIIDVNFNVEGATEEEEERSCVAAQPEGGRVRRSRRKRKSKKGAVSSSVTDLNKKDNESQPTSDVLTSDTLTCEATSPEPFDLESDTTVHAANQTDEELALNLQQRAGRVSEASARETVFEEDRVSGDDGLREERRQGSEDGDDEEEMLWKMEVDFDEGRTDDERVEDENDYDVDDEEMKHRLFRLVAQSRLTYLSSTDDELDRVDPSEGEWDEDNNEQEEEKTEGLTYKLCQLEKEARATQFSSTEDELDRVGVDERKIEEESGSNEELAVKVCRLANQVHAVQFSSTEDELDRVGRDGEQVIDEETLWTLRAEKAVQAAQLRDLASLVSASQFSSTEDELDRVEQDEGEREQVVNEGEKQSSFETEEIWEEEEDRRESFGDLDVKMFDLRDESEETKSEDEKATDEDDEGQRENPETREIEIPGRSEDEITAVEEHVGEDEAETSKETRGRNEMKPVVEAEKTQIIDSNETRVERDNRPEAKTPGENEDETFKESEEGQESWEGSADSEEEDAEFNRIISSMLMMTLEDMQAETAAENGRINKEPSDTEGDGNIQMKEESGVTEKVVEAKSTNDSKETGSVKEIQSDGNSAREKVETATEKNEQEEKDPRERTSLDLETNEAQQTHRKKEEDDEEQEEGSGISTTMVEQKMMETQEAAESKEKDEKLEETQEKREDDSSSLQEGFLSPEEIQHRYSAVSLCSITTQVLKVLNATEELLQGVEGGDDARLSPTSLPPNTDAKKLDQQFSRLEENVYVAAGSAFSLEAELSDLEECARGICSSTSDMELSFLEEQVASAAAKVQQSELQIGDISARIAALKSAGLNVDTQSRLTKTRSNPVVPVTLDSTRQLRRRLPAPPVKEDKET